MAYDFGFLSKTGTVGQILVEEDFNARVLEGRRLQKKDEDWNRARIFKHRTYNNVPAPTALEVVGVICPSLLLRIIWSRAGEHFGN